MHLFSIVFVNCISHREMDFCDYSTGQHTQDQTACLNERSHRQDFQQHTMLLSATGKK